MYEWTDEQQAIIDVMRRFVDEEIRPNLDDLEHNGVPPYAILRKMYDVFGLKEMAKENFARQLKRKISGEEPSREPRGSDPAAQLISTIELCRVSPGLLTSLGVSSGLAAGTINKLGTPAQMERWALDLMTLDKIGAWAITEPDSGSDALGGMRTSAVRDGEDYVLNGQKTWITNGPYADTIVLYAKLDDGSGQEMRSRKVLTFVLDTGMNGLVQAAPMRKMGQHGSPTGEIFLSDVRVSKDRLLGGSETTSSPSARASPRCRSASSKSASSFRSSTPRTAASGARPSPTINSSNSNWRTWKSRASTCAIWSSPISSGRRTARCRLSRKRRR